MCNFIAYWSEVSLSYASVNSKREHPPGALFSHGQIPAPPGRKILQKYAPPRARNLDKNPTLRAFSAVSKDSIFNIDIFIGGQIDLLFQKWLHFNFANLLSAKIIMLYDCRCKVIRILQPLQKNAMCIFVFTDNLLKNLHHVVFLDKVNSKSF